VTVLAYIPARGGSKGVPGKNKRVLCGRPLVQWTIEQAEKTPGIDEILVSTDDREIMEICYDMAVRYSERPAEYAQDDSSIEDGLLWHMENAAMRGVMPDTIVLLQPTSPLRRPHDIGAALAHFEQTHADSLFSAVSTHSPFYWTRRSSGDGTFQWVKPYGERSRRQMLGEVWQENGSIYVFNAKGFRDWQSRLFGKIVCYGMAEDSKYEIDTEDDFYVVERLMERMLAGVH